MRRDAVQGKARQGKEIQGKIMECNNVMYCFVINVKQSYG